LIRDVLVWLATKVGKGPGEYDPSWSEALASTLNVWGLLEGTHVLSLMLFAGTIFLVDFRLLGWGFKKTPVSVISDRILPLTVFGFVLMVVTGVALFYAKPLLYYHNLWLLSQSLVPPEADLPGGGDDQHPGLPLPRPE
jgi:hypothetical protein